MRRLFLLFFLLLPYVTMLAQHDLCLDGELLAHDVHRTGAMPPALRELIRGRQLEERSTTTRSALSAPRRARQATSSIVPVEPLLKSVRDQEEPYNLMCPHWTYDDGTISEERCLSGCVATCIEQIMAYYRYPEALVDTLHGWSTDHYTLPDLLPGTRFDWDNYLLDYRDGWTAAQGNAIALVSLACGMAVKMNYGLRSSGANTYNAVEPLKRAFGYGMACSTDRIFYTPEQWHALIQNELRNGRPVAYAGHNIELHGHAFNIDGVDEQGFYHINWAYNGAYDGWYDLDWLNPWEPYGFDDVPIGEGFFCNHTLLMMHPSADVQPLQTDTMALDQLGIELQRVDFLREPDLQGFVPADFHFRNNGENTVTYTYEVMSYLPTDTAIFYQADYVGLSAITLAPYEERSQRVFLNFSKKGQRILGISHDDETIPFTMSVDIQQGTAPQLEWGSVEFNVQQAYDGSYEATFNVPVANHATSGSAGSLVTLCLWPDGSEGEDMRHWWVLSLPAGQQETKSVVFRHLQPATHYNFILRCPWTIQASTDFWTTIPVGVLGIEKESVENASFDLSGRRVQTNSRGIVIKNGKKWIQR